MTHNDRPAGDAAISAGLASASVLVTCEHASNRIPRRYRNLGLTRADLASHIAWDPGAVRIARRLAQRLGCPCHVGRFSRLLVDLNRSVRNPQLIRTSVAGTRIPGNAELSRREREERVNRYYVPYRNAVEQDVRAILGSVPLCLHLSIHSFTPRLRGVERQMDVGVLYDPRRSRERAFAAALVHDLTRRGLRVARNRPYRGASDGLNRVLRRRFPEDRYVGIELELNQRWVATPGPVHAAQALLASVPVCVARFLSPPRAARSR